jgi:flagellar export protein FliJ
MKTPLENLLSLKRWEEDEAKNLVALAKKDLDLEENRLAGLEENFSILRKKMQPPEKGAVSIDEIKKMNEHMEHLVRLLQRQKDVVAASGKRLNEAMNILAEAAKERKTYETVDGRHKEAERRELNKKEQKGIDEHAVMRYKKHYGE